MAASMQAVIEAGGKGERLRPLTLSLPKPLIEIDASTGETILEFQIREFRKRGVRDLVLCTGYLHDKIEDFLGDGSAFGVRVRYSVEEKPLGTAGCLKKAAPLLSDEFLAVYGDVLFSLDLQKLVDFHKEKKGLATLVLHPSAHPFDSDMVELNPDCSVSRIAGKPRRGSAFVNLSNAGLYVFEKKALSFVGGGNSALDSQVIPRLLAAGEKICGYVTDEFLMDVGTPDRLAKAKEAVSTNDFTGCKESWLEK